MPSLREQHRAYQLQKLAEKVAPLLDGAGGGGTGGRTWQFVKEGVLAVANGTNRIYNDTGAAITLGVVRFSVAVAPTGSGVNAVLKTDGVQSASGTIAAAGSTSTASITNATWPAGSYLTVDITAVGSTTPGEGLVVQITEAASA